MTSETVIKGWLLFAVTGFIAAAVLIFAGIGPRSVKRESTPDFGDIRAFGAKGDGVTDDTAAFLRAQAASVAGVYVPAGTFRIGPAEVQKSIRGEGPQSILKLAAPLTVVASEVRFERLKLLNTTGLAVATTNALLSGISFRDVEFDWVETVRSGFLAINSLYTENLTIDRCKFVRGGIQTTRASNLKIINNYFDMKWANTNEPIHVSHFSRGLISGNTILNSNQDAMDLFSSGDRCIVSQNRIIGVSGEAAITLKISYRKDGNSSGEPLGWTESSVISDNYIKDYRPFKERNRWYGIYASYRVDVPPEAPFTPEQGGRNLVISGNIIDGFWTTNSSNYTNAFFAGVHFDGYGASITGNVFTDISNRGDVATASSTCGVELGFALPEIGVSATGCVVEGNIFNGDGSGLILYNVTSSSFTGNVVSRDYRNNRNPRYGIVVNGQVSNCSFVGNTFNLTADSPAALLVVSEGSVRQCSFNANISANHEPWYLGATEYVAFAANQMGPVTITAASGENRGNVFMANIIQGSASTLPGINMTSPVGVSVTGNTFKNTSSAMRIEGDWSNCLVLNNISEAQTYREFIRFHPDSARAGRAISVTNNLVY